MTEKSTILKLAGADRPDRSREARSTLKQREPILHVEIARPTAKVFLKRPYRDAAYVRTHVDCVVKMTAAQGEQHIIANLASIRRKLEAMGLERETVEQEVRDIQARVRSELWRRILLPEDEE